MSGNSDTGAQAGVTQKEGEAKPPVAGASNSGTPNSDDAFKKLQEENETLKRQYKGSSEEALRLKKENEKLASELTEKSKSRETRKVDTDDAFEALVQEKGTVGAIRHVITEALSPIATKVDTLFEDISAKVLDSFKAKHPGLSKVADKFNTELNRLKAAYSDVTEAMEAAYKLVGGIEADQEVAQAGLSEQEKATLEKQSKEQKDQLARQAGDSSGDRKAAPVNPGAELEAKIKQLQDKALLYSLQGKPHAELLAQIETMKAELAKKRAA